jgi:hypothetical protein
MPAMQAATPQIVNLALIERPRFGGGLLEARLRPRLAPARQLVRQALLAEDRADRVLRLRAAGDQGLLVANSAVAGKTANVTVTAAAGPSAA